MTASLESNLAHGRQVLNEELQNKSVVGWLRNVDHKPWSLEIPYRIAGTVRPMFPDILVIRRVKGFYLIFWSRMIEQGRQLFQGCRDG
jgi:hypothetical protein